MIEEWRDIKGYEGIFQVSNYGRVRSLDRIVIYSNGVKHPYKGKIIKENINKLGYGRVCLQVDCKPEWVFTHRLVAFAFPEICGEYFEGAVINHKDENPRNNCAENLEWCTVSYNLLYGSARDNMLRNRTGKTAQKSVEQYSKGGELLCIFTSIMSASRMTGINHSDISSCCNGKKIKTAGGYIWKFKN